MASLGQQELQEQLEQQELVQASSAASSAASVAIAETEQSAKRPRHISDEFVARLLKIARP